MMKQSAKSIAYRRLIAEALDCGFGSGVLDFGFIRFGIWNSSDFGFGIYDFGF